MGMTKTQELQAYADKIYGSGFYRIEHKAFTGFNAVSARTDTPPHSQFLGPTAAHAHSHLDEMADLKADADADADQASKSKPCPDCGGSGSDSDKEPCPTCAGWGYVDD